MNDDDRSLVRDSRRMSMILRHRPHDFGVELDVNGWASVEALSRGSGIPSDRIVRIAEGNTRYGLSEDRRRIRALHGHSVPVEYGGRVRPPDVLYHGTSSGNLERILVSGSVLPMGRVMVHLSDSVGKAVVVGRRRGEPVVIVIDARSMLDDGIPFHLSEDGVYLTPSVPSGYFLDVLRFGPSITDGS